MHLAHRLVYSRVYVVVDGVRGIMQRTRCLPTIVCSSIVPVLIVLLKVVSYHRQHRDKERTLGPVLVDSNCGFRHCVIAFRDGDVFVLHRCQEMGYILLLCHSLGIDLQEKMLITPKSRSV